jgi:hypothetical protein
LERITKRLRLEAEFEISEQDYSAITWIPFFQAEGRLLIENPHDARERPKLTCALFVRFTTGSEI